MSLSEVLCSSYPLLFVVRTCLFSIMQLIFYSLAADLTVSSDSILALYQPAELHTIFLGILLAQYYLLCAIFFHQPMLLTGI